MLTRFEVEGFKNFDKPYVLDLNAAYYDFNPECVQQSIVKKAMIYGRNGIGKSNLGLAIFDLIAHVTDKEKGADLYKKHYLHANNQDGVAHFKYEFQLKTSKVEYSYSKTTHNSLVAESLSIDGELFAHIDRKKSSIATIHAEGAETLANDFSGTSISLVAYIQNNALLVQNNTNRCFNDFIKFVNGMLFFHSLRDNRYIGLEQDKEKEAKSITSEIRTPEQVQAFQNFLRVANLDYILESKTELSGTELFINFNGVYKPFFELASSGTVALSLFYFWLQRLQKQDTVSFVFIDEFDAFYHHKLAKWIVSLLKEVGCQSIVTTHSTSLFSNNLLRPDCYFIMTEDKVQSVKGYSRKKLRKAHNIERMYKAGSFDE